MNLPIAFEKKMKALLGEEYEAYLRCYEEPRLWTAGKYKENICGRVFKDRTLAANSGALDFQWVLL